jgi:hypothetical protein
MTEGRLPGSPSLSADSGMDRLGPWSAAGGVFAAAAVAAAAVLWPLSSHSSWELALAILATVLVGACLYWTIAALIPLPPFRWAQRPVEGPRPGPDTSVTPVVRVTKPTRTRVIKPMRSPPGP